METKWLPGRIRQGLPYQKDENAAWNCQHRHILGRFGKRASASRPGKTRKRRRGK